MNEEIENELRKEEPYKTENAGKYILCTLIY
jgi:hypothetical protein